MVDAAERAAADEVPKHLGALISGSEADQIEASKSLRALCDKGGAFVHQAVADSNGVPVLLIMLDAKSAAVRRNCINVLCTIGQSASVRTAIMDKEGSMSRLVDAALLLVLSEGNLPATNFLSALAASTNAHIQAICLQARLVPLLSAHLGNASSSVPSLTCAIQILDVLCNDSATARQRLVWANGVQSLATFLQRDALRTEHPFAMDLLVAVLEDHPDAIIDLAGPKHVNTLAGFVGNPAKPLALQAGSAVQLARIAALPVRPRAVTTALAEVALPHACEVLHEQDYQQSQDADASLEHTAQQKLCGNCAVLIAVLSCEEAMVCELIVRHTAQLSKVVQTLVAFSQCTVAQRLLETAHAYALGIRPIPRDMLENAAVAQSASV